MTEFPTERVGFTDMTFCLLRFEVANIFRRILYIPPGPNRCNEFFSGLTIPEKEKWITDCHQRMEEKYLANMDMSIPLCWVTATISRLIMSKMWLIVYHPHQRKDGGKSALILFASLMLTFIGATLPQETKDKLFITSLENIEYSILLETEARTMKWGWLFRTYVQWHAIAFLLSELCVRTKGEAVERAWRALEATAGRWWFPLNDASPYSKGRQGCLWKPLRKLLEKARVAREKELALERASIALRDGQSVFAGFPRGMEQVKVPPVSINQPSSDDLDRMLRPSAPKLGESPLASQSSWPISPPRSNTQMPLPNGPGRASFLETQRPNRGGLNHASGSPGQEFVDLTNFGLDNIVQDVMHDIDYNGNPIYDFSDLQTTSTAASLPNITQPAQMPNPNNGPQLNTVNSTATAINSAHGTFGDTMFTNINFNDMPPPVEDGNRGQPAESPDMDTGNMDWTVWDDMVSRYGLGGNTLNPNTNPASNGGLVNWF
jgi:hypothetical protein